MNGKKLYKIKNGAMLTGVCNGVAAYLDVDVSLVRIAVVLLTCFTGIGVLAYIACAVILPEINDSPYTSGNVMNNANSYRSPEQNSYYNAPDAAPNTAQDNAADNANAEGTGDENGKDII